MITPQPQESGHWTKVLTNTFGLANGKHYFCGEGQSTRAAWVRGIPAGQLYGYRIEGIFRSVGKALASDFVPELLRASAVGWYSAIVGLLGLVASVVAGLLWDHISHAAVSQNKPRMEAFSIALQAGTVSRGSVPRGPASVNCLFHGLFLKRESRSTPLAGGIGTL